MKNRKNLIMAIVLVMIAFFATGDVTQAALADVANDTISVVEGSSQVMFYGTVQYSATDSTNNITTQAIESVFLDWEHATLRVYGNAASGIDVNVFVLGGANLDLTYMSKVYTQTAFDAAGSATPKIWYALADTVRSLKQVYWFVDPVAFERFKVLQFDGQAGNPADSQIYWFLVVPKKEGAPARNAYRVVNTY